MFSRDQLKRAASLTEEDFVQLGRCRRPHNRLGFAYQVAFVRLFDRFPQQQPFELCTSRVPDTIPPDATSQDPLEQAVEHQALSVELRAAVMACPFWRGIRPLDDF